MTKRLLVLGGCALGLLASTAPAGANLPNGRGLASETGISCPALGGTVTIVMPRGQGSATGWTASGQHLVVESVSATGTVTDPAGVTFPADFSRTYGVKAGLSTATCSAHEEGVEDGYTFSIDITAVVGLVPA